MLENIFNENLTNARISIADPTHVPAGIYTKQAFALFTEIVIL